MSSRFKELLGTQETSYKSALTLALGDEEKEQEYKEASKQARRHSLFSSMAKDSGESDEGLSHSLDEIIMKMENALNPSEQSQKGGTVASKSEFTLNLKTLKEVGDKAPSGVKNKDDGTITPDVVEQHSTTKFNIEGESLKMQKKFNLNDRKEKVEKSSSTAKPKVTVGAALGKTSTTKKTAVTAKSKTAAKTTTKKATPKISISPAKATPAAGNSAGAKASSTTAKAKAVKVADQKPVAEPKPVVETATVVETKVVAEPKVVEEPKVMEEPKVAAEPKVEGVGSVEDKKKLASKMQLIDDTKSDNLSNTFGLVTLENLAEACESTVAEVVKWAYKAIKNAFSRGKLPTKSEGIKWLTYYTHFIDTKGFIIASLAADDYLSVIKFSNDGKEYWDVTNTAVVKDTVVTYEGQPIALVAYKMPAPRTL